MTHCVKTELLDRVPLPNRSLRLMCEALDRLELDASPLLRKAGISEETALASDGEILGEQEVAFQRAFVEVTGRTPQDWFRLGRSYRAESFPLLGPAMLTADTVAEGLDTAGTFQGLTYDLLQYRPYGREGRVMGFEATHDDVPEGLEAFVWLRGVAAATTILQQMCPELDITCVDFPLERHEAGLDLEAELGFPVRYGARVLRWIFAPTGAEARPTRACPQLAESFRRRCAVHLGQVREELLAERLTLWLMRSLTRSPSAGDAAAFLGISRRTLYRQLERTERTYGDLVERVRRERAVFLLRYSELPVETIAFKLGFSETASFSRAFKRWTGRPPSVFRKES